MDNDLRALLLQLYEIADCTVVDRQDPLKNCERICHLIRQYAEDRGVYIGYDAEDDEYTFLNG